ncbi:MAG TPA: PIN domain-containing protein [Solirubrobacteraceae bacterium]|nr:PIN domain-containing protein [Solirubrobacteraceae bacterium]
MALGRLLLADKSALERGTPEMFELGEICLCAVVRLEMLYSARNPGDYTDIEEKLSSFRDLRVDAETIATALSAHRELGAKGRHRLPIPDLLIAACAQQHQAAVLHVDRHYDVLAEVLTFEPVRCVTPTSEQ